ncbi:MAG: ABC-type transport auxiliary lipoprotein family protein [Candidatus Wenzhouxiangella sp. M2_3B_020]
MSIRPLALSMLLAAGLCAAGCSILPESEPVQLVDPRVPAADRAGPEIGWTLSIARPETDPARDSDRVLVRTEPGQLKVHSSARWVAPAPELLRTLLIRYLRDSAVVDRVGASVAGSDRTLLIDLRRFELAERGDGLAAVVEIDARLHKTRGGGLVGRRLFEHREAVADAEPESIVAGFEAGLSALAVDVADWLASEYREAQDD